MKVGAWKVSKTTKTYNILNELYPPFYLTLLLALRIIIYSKIKSKFISEQKSILIV